MNTRVLPVITSLVTLIVLGALGLAIRNVSEQRRGSNFLGNPADMADQLVMHDSSAAFAAGKFERTSPGGDGSSVTLNDARGNAFPRQGTWTSAEQATAFAFTEMIPSWNVNTPKDTGVRFHVRVKDANSGEWSPWLYMGYWGRTVATGKDARVIKFEGGEVEIDTLVLHQPADAYQIRATLQSLDETPANALPSVRRISVCYSGEVSDDTRRAELISPVSVPQDWARDLGVGFRAQKDASERLKSQACSPTSTSMVMAFNGVNFPTLENASAIYDTEYNLFGNWNRAVARAGEHGLDAWITRFRNWDQVKATIQQGQPIIASIRFEKGEMPSNPIMQDTDGHIIVIRGLTKDGDVIVNDPARKESQNGKPNGNGVIYKANELAKAWFDRGGVAYIIRKPNSPTTQLAK